MKHKMLVLTGMLVLVVGLLSVTSNAHGADVNNPDLVSQEAKKNQSSKKMAFWVHRRDKNDPDVSGAMAVALRVYKEGETYRAKIWRYTKYENNTYTGRQAAIDVTVKFESSYPNDSRVREKATLRDSSDSVVGYISLYRGKSKKNEEDTTPKKKGTDNVHRTASRAIFRWDPKYLEGKFLLSKNGDLPQPTEEGKRKAVPCEGFPEDNPLEEENLGDLNAVSEPSASLEDPLEPGP